MHPFLLLSFIHENVVTETPLQDHGRGRHATFVAFETHFIHPMSQYMNLKLVNCKWESYVSGRQITLQTHSGKCEQWFLASNEWCPTCAFSSVSAWTSNVECESKYQSCLQPQDLYLSVLHRQCLVVELSYLCVSSRTQWTDCCKMTQWFICHIHDHELCSGSIDLNVVWKFDNCDSGSPTTVLVLSM